MKLLLTSVFKPYGVDDEYGRKENIMELYHNQITREQGIFSLRYHHRSFGLYLIAENTKVPSVILDFPTMDRFIEEIKKGYDYIGISFITPNFIKAKKMAQLIREHAPKSKIILGGHGTQIPDLDKLIDCDHIVKGEGISWFRKFFGEDVEAPIKHPSISSTDYKRVMGIPLLSNTGLLMPGVGCPNACRFCSTTHNFDFKYVPFLKSGRELFDVMQKMSKDLDCMDFFVMDENFLKSKDRAMEVLNLMKEHNKAYYFGIFSSAETIKALGVKFLYEIGIRFLWIGVESKRESYEKNKGVDMKELLNDLRNHGVSVLASTILFQEHHDKETIWEDVDFTLDIRPDFVQFMQLGPLPQTALYTDYKEKGILREDIPYEEWHGQHRLWFKHPHFTAEESEDYLRRAFLRDYHESAPSVLRMAETYLQGYKYTKRYNDDPWLKLRNGQLEKICRRFYPLLDVMKVFMPNEHTRQKAENVIKSYREEFGRKTLAQWGLTAVGMACAAKEAFTLSVFGDVRQPKTLYTQYPRPEFKLFPETLKGRNLLEIKQKDNQNVCLELYGILDAYNMDQLQAKIKRFLARENGPLTLNITNVNKIEDNSLYKLLEQLEQFHSRIKLLYSCKVESINQTIEEIKVKFDVNVLCLTEA